MKKVNQRYISYIVTQFNENPDMSASDDQAGIKPATSSTGAAVKWQRGRRTGDRVRKRTGGHVFS